MNLKFWKRQEVTEADVTKAVDEVLTAVGLVSESGMTRADLDLMIDDAGWSRGGYGAQNSAEAAIDQKRPQLVKQSRLYWHRDPLAKQAVRIWTDYSVNTGLVFKVTDDADDQQKQSDRKERIAKVVQANFKAQEAGEPVPTTTTDGADENSDVDAKQEALEKFWRDKRNRRLTGTKGQRKLATKHLIDGELFLACWELNDGKVVRKMDPLEITHIIKDPDDGDCILGYRREWSCGNQTKHAYYRDFFATDDEMECLPTSGPNHEPITFEDDVLLYHFAFDDLGDRGNGLLFSGLDWTREHRRFMEARVSITQSLAKFAYKLTAKGGQKAVDKLKQALESTFVGGLGSGIEKNPKPAAASTFVSNQGAEIDALPRTTGASDAKGDGDQLKLMHCAGTGIMLHYFGDPSTGNLATATAMELPMLKMFETYQEQWADVWRDIFLWVLGEDPQDEEATPIDIDYPPIVQKDLGILATALSGLTAAFPELKIEPVLVMILTALGINNLDAVLDMIEQAKQENEVKQQQIMDKAEKAGYQIGPDGKPLPPHPSAVPPTKPAIKESASAEEMLAAAIDRLCESMDEGEHKCTS